MEANTSHLLNCVNISTEESSLLMLNDDCFMAIFELLQFSDFVNLAKTCNRLYSVALDAAVKIKEIEFAMFNHISNDKVTRSKKQFLDILSVFGGHVESIKMKYGGSDFVFQTIRDNCQKLNSLELESVAKLPSQYFNNLRELKIYGCLDYRSDELSKVFTSNPNIESLEVVESDHFYKEDNMSKFVKLLQLLPKLKILKLKIGLHMPGYQALRSLLNSTRLPHLTKLSLFQFSISNALLIELATKSNLVELKLDCLNDYDVHGIKLFKNLEILQLHYRQNIPENAVFPPKLKFLRFSRTSTSCRTLITIVKELKFLEEFDLRGNKIWYRARGEVGNYQSQIVARIVDEIAKRNVQIIYPDVDDDVDEPYLYNSSHLKIIRKRFWPLEKSREPVRMPNVFLPV